MLESLSFSQPCTVVGLLSHTSNPQNCFNINIATAQDPGCYRPHNMGYRLLICNMNKTVFQEGVSGLQDLYPRHQFPQNNLCWATKRSSWSTPLSPGRSEEGEQISVSLLSMDKSIHFGREGAAFSPSQLHLHPSLSD